MMNLQSWVTTLSKCKQAVLKTTDFLLQRVSLEPIAEDEKIVGVKAVWVGERGESVIKIDSPTVKGTIGIEGEEAPAIEYRQQGNKRGFISRNPKNLFFEFDRETLNRLQSAKSAWIATTVGAAAGLAGWLVLTTAGRLVFLDEEAQEPSTQQIESKEDENET